MASLGQLVVEISTDLTNFNKGLVDAEKKVRDTTGKISELTNKIGTGLTVAGAAITGAFALMIKSSVDYADQIYDVSQRTGIATETLSRLKYVAEQTESSFEGLTVGLRILSKNIYDAYTGGAKTNETFRELGISVTDASGKMVSAENALFAIADKFKGLDDATAKSALALQLFGRGGTAIIPVLNLGSEGIKKLSDQADRLGITLTTGNARAIDKFSDDMKSLKASVGGLWLNISLLLIPILEKLVKFLTDVTVAFRKFSEAHPILSKNISALALVFGILMLAIGPLLIALPPLITMFAALGVAAAPVWITVGLIAAAVGGLTLIVTNATSIWRGFLKAMQPTVEFWTGKKMALPEEKTKEEPAAPGAVPSIMLDDTVTKVQRHAEALKVLNDEYLAGTINAKQYYTEVQKLHTDGLDIKQQELDLLQQSIDMERLSTDAEYQKIYVMNEGVQSARNFANVKAEMANQDLMDQQTSLNSATQLLQTIQSMHQTVWSGIFGMLNTGIKTFSQGFSTALSGIILGTMTVGQAFKQLGVTMLQAIVNFFVEWAVQAALAMVLQATVGAATMAIATGIAAAWLPAAIFASVATLGAADAAGSAGLAGSVASGAAMFAGLQAARVAAAVPMAEGGFGTVTKPTLFLAGERGQEDFAFSPVGKGGIQSGNTINLGGIHIDSPIIKNDMDIEDLAEKLGSDIQRKLRRVS